MKYSKRFEEDYEFYISNLDNFAFAPFDVQDKYDLVSSPEDGESAKHCFYKFINENKTVPCAEIDLLERLFITKDYVDFCIKRHGESRAKINEGLVETHT